MSLPQRAEDEEPRVKRFQFRLSELFVFITAFCMTFALLGQFGWSGLAMRFVGSMFIIAPFVPLIYGLELYRWWRVD